MKLLVWMGNPFPYELYLIVNIAFFLILSALVAIVLLWRKKSSDAGDVGEKLVRKHIRHSPENGQYVINGYCVRVGDTSMQVDHIVINQNGVHVIETKNYSGLICGRDEDYQWTQILKGGRTRNTFYNPVLQNETHIRHLASILGREGIFYNMIVFFADDLKVESNHIVRNTDLENILSMSGDTHLSPEEVHDLYRKLLYYHSENAITVEEHIENISLQ